MRRSLLKMWYEVFLNVRADVDLRSKRARASASYGQTQVVGVGPAHRRIAPDAPPRRQASSASLALWLSLGAILAGPVWGGCGTSRQYHSVHAGNGQSNANIPPEAQWVAVHVPDTGTTLRMPGQPNFSRASEGVDDDGARYRTTVGIGTFGRVIQLSVITSHIEGGVVGRPFDRLRGIRESLTEGNEEQAFSVVNIAGSPGFDCTFVDGESGGVVHVRSLVGRHRVYIMMAVVAPQLDRALSTVVSNYMQSLRLDPVDSFSAVGDGVYRAGQWRWSIPAEAAFAARFPGAPRSSSDASPIPDAEFVRTYRVVGEGGATFEVRALGFEGRVPAGAVQTLENAPLAHYSLRAARDTTRQGYSGRTLVYESAGRMRFTLLFATDRATYEVSVDLPRTADRAMLDARNTFLNSFRVL